MSLNSRADRAFSWLYSLGFFVGLGFCFLYAQNQILTGDQTQMLYKGYLGAYQDTWLNFGNAASAVGNVPGSLSTWLIGGPLLIWDSPWSPMVLLIAMRIVSLWLLDNVIKNTFQGEYNKLARLLFLALYWLNPWFLYDSLLYNPSYLCLFAAMHLWSATKMRERKSIGYTFIHVLSIGLAMQLHYSWPILAVISVYLFYRKMGYISWIGVIAAVTTLVVSLIPYLQEYAVNESISRDSDRYFGYGLVHVYPVLKALLYWLRYGSMLFSNKVIAFGEFEWLTNIEWLKVTALSLWKAMIFLIGGISVVVSARLNWLCWQRIKPMIRRSNDVIASVSWIELYAFSAVIGVLISAALSPITFSYWHLIMVYPFAIIPILSGILRFLTNQPQLNTHSDKVETRFSRFVERYSVTRKIADIFADSHNLRLMLVASFGYLLVLNLLASHDSLKFSYQSDYVSQVESYLYQQQLLPKGQ
ncbi:3-deoxy-D-manno-octulosonic acid transferase [Vibrio maritimus]|uniref:3-deoxy-D-manno-octulosonic acid transferase n=1 Tax=Vibrio maritimus TaxID=990268 RepID=UPI004068FC9F